MVVDGAFITIITAPFDQGFVYDFAFVAIVLCTGIVVVEVDRVPGDAFARLTAITDRTIVCAKFAFQPIFDGIVITG